jgi:threonine/homoserine/homoserine lactone efflux protein
MAVLFFSSFFLGIAYCAPPGIITAETIRRGVLRGFWPALLVQLGSLFGDTTWATIAITGAAFLVQNWIARLLLSLLGIGLLLRLAWKSLSEAFVGTTLQPAPLVDGPTPSRRSDLVTGMLLSLGNPYAIAFWAGISGSVFATVSGGLQWQHFAAFFIAFLSGALLWCFMLAGLISWGRQYVNSNFFRWVNLTCGLVLGYFGLNLAWQILQSF